MLAIENTCGCIDFKFLKTVFIVDNPNLFYIKCWSAHEEAAIQFCVCIVVECVSDGKFCHLSLSVPACHKTF